MTISRERNRLQFKAGVYETNDAKEIAALDRAVAHECAYSCSNCRAMIWRYPEQA